MNAVVEIMRTQDDQTVLMERGAVAQCVFKFEVSGTCMVKAAPDLPATSRRYGEIETERI